MNVRPLRKEEIAPAALALATAFDADPLFRFLLPDAARRQGTLLWFLRSALNECFSVGGAFTLEEGGPDTCAMGLVPPGRWPIPLHRTITALAMPRTLPTWRLISAGLRIEHEIRQRHPAGRHVYVNVLGVHPSMKGKGCGAALMRHARSLGSEQACPTHLETSNPINLPFYRRFELEVVTEIVSHGGPPVWTMTTPGEPA